MRIPVASARQQIEAFLQKYYDHQFLKLEMSTKADIRYLARLGKEWPTI
jgi:hypothetical protein